MHNDAPKLLETLWQLQKDPDFNAGDILLKTELSADEGQTLQVQLLERWLNEGEALGGVEEADGILAALAQRIARHAARPPRKAKHLAPHEVILRVRGELHHRLCN